ncbi:MAG: hypothetical protein N3F64_00715 [Nitrososphaeria archaeon]|nr:hypothetical protein [Nitrososphaeria archaeon]
MCGMILLGEIGVEIYGIRDTAKPVVFWEEDVYILGTVNMEQLGLVSDPIQKRLKSVKAFLMNKN